MVAFLHHCSHVFFSPHIQVSVQPAGVSEAGAELLTSCTSPRPAAQSKGEAVELQVSVGASAGNVRSLKDLPGHHGQTSSSSGNGEDENPL